MQGTCKSSKFGAQFRGAQIRNSVGKESKNSKVVEEAMGQRASRKFADKHAKRKREFVRGIRKKARNSKENKELSNFE